MTNSFSCVHLRTIGASGPRLNPNDDVNKQNRSNGSKAVLLFGGKSSSVIICPVPAFENAETKSFTEYKASN